MAGIMRTVTDDVWQAVARVTSEAFADSYLYGAEVRGGELEPRLVIAFDALRRDSHVVDALKALGLALKKPLPWRDGGGKRSAAECYGALSDAPIRRQSKTERRTQGNFG